MVEDLVNIFSEEIDEAFQRSIFVAMDELVEAWEVSNSFCNDNTIENLIYHIKVKPKTKVKNSTIQVLNDSKSKKT